jgi:hypothetical protein
MKDYDYIDYVDYSFDANPEGEDFYNADNSNEEFYKAEGSDDFYNVEADVDEFFNVESSSDDFYNANAKQKKVKKAKAEKQPRQKGQFKAKLKTFLGKLKPNKKARKLQQNASNPNKYNDILTALKKKTGTDGQVVYAKTNPDNTTTILQLKDVASAPNGEMYDKKDLAKSGDLQIINNEAVKVVDATEVVTLPTTDGDSLTFRKEDVAEVSEETGVENKDSNKGVTIALIVGGVLVVGAVVVYLVMKNKNSKA